MNETYTAMLTLAVASGPDTAETLCPAGWDIESYDVSEYAQEWAWLAEEHGRPEWQDGTVMRFTLTVAEGTEAAETFLRDFATEAGATLASMAELCAYADIVISPMDWNVSGVTYVIDAGLSIVPDAAPEHPS